MRRLSIMVELHLRGLVLYYLGTYSERTTMLKFLNWAVVIQLISVPVLLILAIWNSDLRFLWISLVIAISTVFTSGYAEVVRRQNVDTLF